MSPRGRSPRAPARVAGSETVEWHALVPCLWCALGSPFRCLAPAFRPRVRRPVSCRCCSIALGPNRLRRQAFGPRRSAVPAVVRAGHERYWKSRSMPTGVGARIDRVHRFLTRKRREFGTKSCADFFALGSRGLEFAQSSPCSHTTPHRIGTAYALAPRGLTNARTRARVVPAWFRGVRRDAHDFHTLFTRPAGVPAFARWVGVRALRGKGRRRVWRGS